MSSRLMEMIESRSKRHFLDDSVSLKVSSHWKLIKAAIQRKEGADPRKLDKSQPLVVGHGVHPFTSVPSDKTLELVVLNTFNENYVGVDSEGGVTVFLSSGYTQDMSKNLSRPLTGAVYASRSNNFVAWGGDETLMLLSESFRVVSTATSVSKITSAVYNSASNEVITGGVGNVTCWSFRYGAKFMLQRKVFRDELPTSCQISCLCLEDTSSRTQKCFAAYDRSVVAYTLLDGTCAAHFKDMHTREITALLFFNPLKFLVSAARDGSIKVWDSQGNIKIIFVGHLNSVNCLAVYPFGPYIMSGSTDCTIRVWSLETADEVDRINTPQPVKGLHAAVNNDSLYSFGANSVDLWKIEHVHSIFTTTGSTVKSIKPTTHPRMPLRMVCSCGDAAVRLISPGSGECVTSLLIPDLVPVVDVVYAAGEGLLFTLLNNGKILKASTLANPCKILDSWSKEQTAVPSQCTCLCLYEYVVEDKLEGDSWKDLVTTLKAKAKAEELDGEQQTNNAYDRTLLLGGCANGSIVVFDWLSKKTPGKVSFQIEAHREEVVTMIASPANDQVISAGYDNTVKIWRLFPFAQEALAPLMTLFCQETPRHLSVAHHRLCVAFHEPATASYNIGVFKTTQKERYDHSSDQDHTDDVTGLASCPKMRLFASCSADGSVRVWDEANKLIRVIKLNATPSSVCFCSEKGDLIVSIGKHLHKIGYATYMPQSYIFRMVAMEFRRAVAEKPLPIEKDVHDSLSSPEKQRLVSVKSSKYKFSHFSDALSHEEMEEKAEEEERRQKAFSKIQEREDELRKLRDGCFEFSRKRPAINTEAVRGKAFERYLDIFYKKPAVQIPDEDELDDDLGPKYEEQDVYSPERGPAGFFSISRQSTRSRKSQPSPAKLAKPELTSRSPVKPVIPELMSLSLPEFEPVKPLEETEGSSGGEEEHPRTESPDERPLSRETDDSKFVGRRTISRVSTSAPSGDFRSLPLEPPLLNRDRYVIDVPKSNRYPSSGLCRHVVAQRVSQMASESLPDDDEESFVIAPDGYIPNSVVVALFKDFREEPKEEAEGKVPWKPPQLTAEQLAELQKRKKKPKSPEEEPSLKRKDSKQSKFAEQMRLALRDVPTPEPIEEIDIYKSPTPTPPPSPPPDESSPVKTPSPKPKKDVKPLRPIEKLVSRPKIPTPPPPIASTSQHGVNYNPLPMRKEDSLKRQLKSNHRNNGGAQVLNSFTRERETKVSDPVTSGPVVPAPLCTCTECVDLCTRDTWSESLKRKNYDFYTVLVSKKVKEQERYIAFVLSGVQARVQARRAQKQALMLTSDGRCVGPWEGRSRFGVEQSRLRTSDSIKKRDPFATNLPKKEGSPATVVFGGDVAGRRNVQHSVSSCPRMGLDSYSSDLMPKGCSSIPETPYHLHFVEGGSPTSPWTPSNTSHNATGSDERTAVGLSLNGHFPSSLNEVPSGENKPLSHPPEHVVLPHTRSPGRKAFTALSDFAADAAEFCRLSIEDLFSHGQGTEAISPGSSVSPQSILPQSRFLRGSPTPPREPTPTPPPPPPTPLPDFIMQFSGLPWFETVFPNVRPETIPKPWTVSAFVELLLSFLPRMQDFDLKSQICAAIMLLNRQEGLDRECAEQVKRALLAELNVPRPPTSHGSPEEARFVRVDIQLLQAVNIFDVSFVAELMAQYIDGDEHMRNFVEEILVSIGVQDRRGYFLRELDTFDVWDIPENKRKLKVKSMCAQWLQNWLGQFRDHIRSLAGKISRAQAGSVVKGTKRPNTPSSIKGILKKEQSSETSTPSGRPPNVSFNVESLGGAAADNATPVEAINYFCELKIQEELDKARARAREKSPASAQDNSRNTVLILPKIHSKRSLARLGETHCSHCHPERETALALAFPLPPIHQSKRGGVLNNVALHLNTLTLNPFPEEDDLHVYEAAKHSSLITLRTAHKYFFPAQSLAYSSAEEEEE